MSQRVEHVHNRHTRPVGFQHPRHPTRQPVVAVNHVVLNALFFCEMAHAIDEGWEILPDHQLRRRRFRPGDHVNHPHVRPQVGVVDVWHIRVLGPCEAINLHPVPAQLAAQLSYIDIHPTRLLTTQSGQRTGVNA